MRRRVVIAAVMLVNLMLGLWLAPAASAASSPLEISELLPDPAPPLTDTADEYVEFYNGGTASIILSDYSVRVGTSSYPLPGTSVPAGGHVVIKASAAPWSLANAGGTMSLLQGSVEIQSVTWPKAVTGAAWARAGGAAWAWTSALVPTPAAPAGNHPDQSDGAMPVELTELLPDPAPPLSDVKDEFIEIYNPGSSAVNLAGYVIKTGAGLTVKHTLPSVAVPPGGYAVLKSGETKIALSNSGTSVALFSPAGVQVGPAITYGKAHPGEAWARFADAWSWTTTATAATPNLLTQPATAPSTAATATKTASKTSVSTPKAKAAPKAASTKAPAKSPAPLVAAASTSQGHWLLFALAGLTIAYIIYEFRYDLRNFYYRLRRHSSGGQPPRPIVAGRGGHRVSE